MSIQHIIREEGKLGNKPHIAGTRMSVNQISLLHKAPEWSVERIVDEFDLTTHAQIYAALAYYYNHQSEIDMEILTDDNNTWDIAKPLSDMTNSDS